MGGSSRSWISQSENDRELDIVTRKVVQVREKTKAWIRVLIFYSTFVNVFYKVYLDQSELINPNIPLLSVFKPW